MSLLQKAALCLAVAAPLLCDVHAQHRLAELSLETMDAFAEPAPNWSIAGAASSDLGEGPDLAALPGSGVLVNRPAENARGNLLTAWEHGDIEMELEFLLPEGTNSGIYLQGRYEIQLLDSWGRRHPTFADLGGIYERWDDGADTGFEGRAPRLNAGRAPGLWQNLRIVFAAPRFDEAGRKTRNARFAYVELNGVAIHENIEVTGPTRSAAFADERPAGPLMFQGDHGPVAFRNVRFKRYGRERVRTEAVRYRITEGHFESLPDLRALTPTEEKVVPSLSAHTVDRADPLAVTYEGSLHIPAAGTHRFALTLGWITGDPHFDTAPIGGGALSVGGKTVLEHAVNQPTVEGSLQLEAGVHPFALTVYKTIGWRPPSIALHVEGPGTPRHALTAPEKKRAAPSPIRVDASGEPTVLRAFVLHDDEKHTRAVLVGDPLGVHFALDTRSAALLYVWRGPFADATAMWHNRGQDQIAVPLGSPVTLGGAPPFDETGEEIRFLGYELGDSGHPTFRYALGRVTLEDSLMPDESGRFLTRTVTWQGGPPARSVRIARAATITYNVGSGLYVVGDGAYYLRLSGGAKAEIRTASDARDLVVPVTGEASVLSYDIVW